MMLIAVIVMSCFVSASGVHGVSCKSCVETVSGDTSSFTSHYGEHLTECPVIRCVPLYNTCHQTSYTLLDINQVVRGCGIAVEEAFRDEICAVLIDNIPIISNCSTVEDVHHTEEGTVVPIVKEHNAILQPIDNAVTEVQYLSESQQTSPPQYRQTFVTRSNSVNTTSVYTSVSVEEDNNSGNDVIEYSILDNTLVESIDSERYHVRRNSTSESKSGAFTGFCHWCQTFLCLFLLYAVFFIIGDLCSIF